LCPNFRRRSYENDPLVSAWAFARILVLSAHQLGRCRNECCESLAKLSPPQAGQTIIFFGDSLTEGVGRRLSVCVVARTWFAVINTASAGDTTAEVLARYPTQCGLRFPVW
jgi:lysophospholipase L1-like esterase